MAIHRLKRSFTAGELSPLMDGQTENDRYRFGCRQLKNMYVRPQGPVSRREGLLFKYDITTLIGTYGMTVPPRLIPFVFDENQAYAIVMFYYKTGGTTTTRCVFAVDDGLVEDPVSPGDPYIFEFTGTFELEKIVYKQSADIIFIAQPNRKPIEFKRLAADNWSANEIVFTDMPTDWNATDGWPEFVDFFEQRILYASTWKRPQTLWFSKSGDFYGFGKSTPIVASDAVTLTMDSGTQNKIRWTNTSTRVLVGTLGDEWAVSGSGYEPLSFQSNRTARHTNVGAEKLQALMIGNVTIFLERHGRKVNQFVFDFNADAYDTVDLSVLAPHLTDNNRVVNWTYHQSPHGIIWAVRDDGDAIAMTFKREHKVAGWHHHDTDGKFLDFCAIPGQGDDDLWALVERTIGGNRKWYLEKKAPEFKSDDVRDSYFLDSMVVYNGAAAQTITGLSHLEGKAVSVLADGAVLTERVVTSGQIVIEVPATRVVVGLPYESIAEPILLDNPLKDGTSLNRIARITDVSLRIYRSLLFEYGRYNDYGELVMEEKPFRYPSDNTGQQVPLFTGNIDVSFQEGYDSDARFVLRQSKPLPLTLLYVVDTVEVYD